MTSLARCAMVLTAALTMPVLAADTGSNWPQFRGPGSAGLVTETTFPTAWGLDKSVGWKIKVPGYGWASPIVWGDKVFITTAVSDKQTKPAPMNFGGGFGGGMRGGKGGDPKGGFPKGEFPKGGFGKGGFGKGGGGFNMRAPDPPKETYRWEVHCLDANTGKTLWKQTATEKRPAIATHRTNTYASETPVTDGERLYCYFGMTGLFCYDLAGKQVWQKDLGAYPMQFGWGTGSSPILDGDRLFLQIDNEQKSFLVALNKTTGDELWRVPREEKSTWSTPYIWKNSKRTELVAGGSQKARSYDPATGKLLWEMGGFSTGGMMGMQCSATPVGDADLLYLGTGGGMGAGPLVAIRAGASGDISLSEDEESNSGVAWRRTGNGPPMASPLLHQGYLYILGRTLSCFEAKTGKPAYRERIPGAKGFTSSPWALGDKIFCLDEDGQTFVVQAGPKFKVLTKNSLNEMFWSSPAIAGGAIFLRGVEHLFCIR